MRTEATHDHALTLFQPPGTGLRIALATGRGAREGRVDWVRRDPADVEEVLATALDLGRTRAAVAVVSGGPTMSPDRVATVLALCLGTAGFDELKPGCEVTQPASAAA